MIKFTTAAAVTLTSFGVAAADLPVRTTATAPVMKAAPMNWTGCSVGVAGGYGWHKVATPVAAIGEGDYDAGQHTADGATIGGRASCDLQFGAIVVGAQGAFDKMNINGINVFYPNPLPEFTTSEASWGASATLRAGLLLTPDLLVYVRGGAAWLKTRHKDYDTGVGGPTFIGVVDATRSGWTVGAGIEYAITRNWFAGVEYNYADFGAKNLRLDGTLYPGITDDPYDWSNRYANKWHAVTAGIRYKFF